MTIEFTIRDWSAFAADVSGRDQWAAWAANPFLPEGDAAPALAEMPPMQRRRVDRLGRMALQVAWWCQQDRVDGVPMVFASRHGDLGRTYEMLRSLVRGEPVSPTQFGLSTHNAVSAQYSIARSLIDNCICVSAGTATPEAAVVEALGLLADGASEVLVVVYDCPLPNDYAAFADEPGVAFAWAARLALADGDDVAYSLQVGCGRDRIDASAAPQLPHGLDVLRFLIGDRSSLQFDENGRTWRWERHA
jgi:hypothetical protein